MTSSTIIAGNRGRTGEKADRDQDAAEEFCGGQQRRPEDAGVEAEAFDHADSPEGIDDLAVTVGYEQDAAQNAQQRFGKGIKRQIDLFQCREDCTGTGGRDGSISHG